MIAPLVRIQMLGAFCVQQEERLITRFRYQKAAALLAYLAFYRARMHPREEIIERLWPEFSPDASRNNLSNILSSLRNQLEPPGTPAGAVLIADRFHVGLRSELLATDVADFEAHLRAAGQEAEAARQIRCLSDALALYSGPLLPGFYDAWIGAEGQRLSDAFLQAARRLVRLLAKAGEREQALEIARLTVRADPLREEAHRDLMQLYVATGQPSAALAQYRELEGVLEQELGAAPSSATRRWIGDLRERLGARALPAEGDATALQPAAAAPTPPGTLPSGHETAVSAGLPNRIRLSKAALPSGTVTFLILAADTPPEPAGDPGGTSGAWERRGDLLRDLFARHRGQVVKMTRRELSVAFASASDASGCALAVWKALESSPDGRGWSGSPHSDGARLPAHVEADALSRPVPELRYALHTGDVAPERSDLPEQVRLRTQRLALAGHPGQLLCSETTTALLRRDLEPGVQLLDLGLYRLGGGLEAERVWQIAVAGMRAKPFPPLRAEAGTPSRLPPPLTRFFGREAELGRLLALLRPASPDTGGPERSSPAQDERQPPTLRLVTLTGPGGIGKTRLALEAGARLEADWEGAVWFVPFADLSDAGLIPSALVSALGLPRSGTVEPLDQVVAALEARPALLLLDNFEHLVEEGAGLVRRLLQRIPTLTCLVTSRQRLEIAGEHEMALMPLPVPAMPDSAPRRHSMPDATVHAERRDGTAPSPEGSPLSESYLMYESVRLFVDRAQAVRPDFQITAGNATAIATLCAGLEGIPLALELAASRAQVLTPAQMAAQLKDRFTLLVSRRRDMAARHRTLLSAVEWSYRLLPDELKRVFARLSVFRGGWDLAAAEAIGADLEMAPLDALAQLQECSLILTAEQGDVIRFRMLETLREYAQRRLQESGEEAAISRRHTEFYLAQAEQAAACLQGPEQGVWLDRIQTDLDNFRAALNRQRATSGQGAEGLRLAVALWRFWEMRGYWKEGREYLAALLARADNASPAVERARALQAAGVLAERQGDLGEAQALLEEGMEIARVTEDRTTVAASLHILGSVAFRQCDYPAARARYEESLALQRRLENRPGIASVLYSLGFALRVEGEYAGARLRIEECLTLYRDMGDRRGVALGLNALGLIVWSQGDYDEARRLFEECLAVSDALRYPEGMASAMCNLGIIAHELGDFVLARQRQEACLEIFRALGANRSIAGALNNLGLEVAELGDYARAHKLFVESLLLRRTLNDKVGIAALFEAFAELAMRHEQPEQSAGLWAAAMTLRERIGAPVQPNDRAEIDRSIAAVRSVLGSARFAAAWAQGSAMTMEETISSLLEA
jgi:predicted ATPase/DNA-binding SARP family transcriptional activator/Tfp pilus assembly protein PilF